MKRYLLIILLTLPLSGCASFLAVFFGSTVSNLTGASCDIHIETIDVNNTFYDAPDGSPVSFAEVMDIPDDFANASVITLSADINATSYTIASGEYWFQVRIAGNRTFEQTEIDLSQSGNTGDGSSEGENSGDGSSSDENESTIYEQSDFISGGTYWVRGTLDDLGEGCWTFDEEEGEGASEELAIPYLSLCFAVPQPDKLPISFRIGAGNNRAVRFLADQDFEYDVIGYSDEPGTRWYQVETDVADDPLWVNSEDIDLEGICTDIPSTASPEIIRPENGNGNVGAPTCANFAILSPIGTVPDETWTYEWSPVADADTYALNFYDYQGNLAETRYIENGQTSVDIYTGSINTGSQLSIEVFAMRGGEVLCGTGRSAPITRLAARVVEGPAVSETPEKEKKDKKKDGGGYTPPGD